MAGDIKNKTVNIYIDQSSALIALEALQKKSDGFNKKIDEARLKQKQLLETIEKSSAAAANIDKLKSTYNALSKEIDNNTKRLAENESEQKSAATQLKQLNEKLDDAKVKQASLTDEIKKNDDAGKSTIRLKQQYETVGKEIDRTTEKIKLQTDAYEKRKLASQKIQDDTVVLKSDRTAIKGDIKLAGSAVKTINTSEKEFLSLNKSIDANTASLQKNNEAQKEVQSQIDKGVSPSLRQQETLVRKLRNQFKDLHEGTEEYAVGIKKLRSAETDLNRLQTAMNGVEKAQRSWFAEAKTVAFGVLIGNTVQSAIQALGSYLGGIVSGNAKLSDSLANIEKATGLSKRGVQELNKELGTIDTRTKAAELREIAVGLGQIGEAADKAKVQAIDQIVVALGDEFNGGAKEITTTLSVLRNNLGDIKTANYAEDVSHIGNALNVLGAEGLATAPVVTDIANRIAGIARTFKLSSGQILGLAATFQELGIETERGSTAVTKLFQKIGAEPEKFAKVAGIGIKQFKDLVNKDMLGAFTAVAEGAKKAGGNNVIFSQILKELDADGSGAGEVLSKLGSNATLLASKVELSSKALLSNSSIVDEFTKKNTNLAAEAEKLDKKLSSLLQSQTLTEFFTGGVRFASQFIDVLRAIPKYIKENQVAIYLLITGLVIMNGSYIALALSIARKTIVTALDTAATKLQAVATELSAAAQLTYGLIVEVVTGKIKLAAAATQFYSIILRGSLGPIGAVITLVGALSLALVYMFSKTEALTATQIRANHEMEKSKLITATWAEVQQNANAKIGETVTKLQDYAKAAEDTSKSDAERKQAIQGIIDINPEYFKGLDLEAVKTGVLSTKVNEYTEALRAAALQKAIFDKRVTLEQKKLDLQEKLTPEPLLKKDGKPIQLIQPKKNTQDALVLPTVGEQLFTKSTNKIKSDIDLVDGQLKFLDKKAEELKKKTKNILGLEGNETSVNPFGNKKTPEEKAASKKAGKEDSERDKLLKELRDFQFELEQIGKISDEKEIDRITRKYDDLAKKAAKYSLSVIEVEKAKSNAIAFLLAKEERERQAAAKKQQQLDSDERYKKFISNTVNEGEDRKDTETKKYAASLINKKDLEQNIRKIDSETLDYEIVIAESFVGLTKQASTDLLNFKKQKNKEEIADAVRTREQREALDKRERSAAAAVAVLKTPANTKARLDALQNQLKVEHDIELENTDLTNSEKEKLNQEFYKNQGDLIRDFFFQQIQQTLEFISSAVDIISKFGDAKSNKENAALAKELKDNDARKASIKKLEDSKVISTQESRRRIRAIEIEEDKRKEDLDKKQHERQKRFAIAQAIINGAMAVTKILAETPKFDFGIATAIQIGLAVATTAAEVAVIASQKFAEGGLIKAEQIANGKISSSQNIPTQPNGDNIFATVKQGEVILNEQQQQKLGGPSTFKKIGVPGFEGAPDAEETTTDDRQQTTDDKKPSSVIRHPSSITKGFAGGGLIVKPFWQTRPFKNLNVPAITRSMQVLKFAEGGLVQNNAPTQKGGESSAPTDPALLQILEGQQVVMSQLQTTVSDLKNQLSQGIQAFINLNKLEDAQKQMARIRNDAGLR